MHTQQRTLFLKEEGRSSPAQRWMLAGSEIVEAIDHLTRATIHIRVTELSAYRHTLRREGRSFRILNIIDLAG